MNKCEFCNRKVDLINQQIKCACGKNMLCAYHRKPFQHGCKFDFFKEQKTHVEKTNPRVVVDKIENRLQ